jgi:hypothetical protein
VAASDLALDLEDQFYLVLPLLILRDAAKALPFLLAALLGSGTVLRLVLVPSDPTTALLVLRAAFGATAFTIFGSTIASIGIAGFLGAIICGAPEPPRDGSPLLRYFGGISYCLYPGASADCGVAARSFAQQRTRCWKSARFCRHLVGDHGFNRRCRGGVGMAGAADPHLGTTLSLRRRPFARLMECERRRIA